MGYDDRDYNREQWDTGSGWKDRSGWQPKVGGTRSMVTTLIIINAVIFIADAFSGLFTGEQASGGNIQPLMQFLALETDVYQKPWNIWTLLSYGFAHSSITSKLSIFHIGGNMLILFFLGRPLEQRLGAMEFLKFYLIAIVASGIGYVVLNFGSPYSRAVGASGAASAIVALFAFLYPKQKLLLMGIIPMPAWLLGALMVGTDLFRAFDPESNIAWQCHLAGFAFGAAYFYWSLNFSWLRLEKIGDLFKPRTQLKVHKVSPSDKLQQQADSILEKINEQGEDSLSSRERKILKKYSDQIRNQRD